MAPTANKELTDAFIRHQIYLNRYSAHLTNEIRKELDATIELAKEEIENMQKQTLTSKSKNLANKLVKLRLATWNTSWRKYIQEIKRFSKGERQHIKKIITNSAPVHLILNIPSQDALAKIVKANMTHLRKSGEDIDYWMTATTKADLKKITRIARYGVAAGLPTNEIGYLIQAQNVLADKYVQGVSRTFVKHISSSIRREVAVKNKDIFQNERFIATLDAGTTLICATKDGNIYPIGKGPELPLHFGCRSELVPTLNGERLGDRPAKNTTKKLALKSYARKHDIWDYRDVKMTPKVKEYIRDYINDRTGQIPSKTTYAQWFARQSQAVQDEILGPKRADIYRGYGNMTLDKFIDKSGIKYTLAQLGDKYNVGLLSDSY